MKYNQKQKYNNISILYNSSIYQRILNLIEVLNTNDFEVLAYSLSLLLDEFLANEKLLVNAQSNQQDDFNFTEEQTLRLILSLIENLSIDDSLIVLLSFADIIDNMNYNDKLDFLAKAFDNDKIQIEEILKLLSLVVQIKDILSIANIFDDISSQANLLIADILPVTDIQLRKAISDLIITSTLDKSAQRLLPFDMVIDWKQSKFPKMPPILNKSMQLENVDGEIDLGSVYGAREIQLMLYSENGLTENQKREFETLATYYINQFVKKSNKLSIAGMNISFDVKAVGLADFNSYGQYVSLNLQLKAFNPYATTSFDEEAKGNTIIRNVGAITVGATIEITGYCQNPTVTISGNVIGNIGFKGAIQPNETLVFDNNSELCYIIDNNTQTQKQVRQHMTGNFFKLPTGQYTIASNNIPNPSTQLFTTLSAKFLWGMLGD